MENYKSGGILTILRRTIYKTWEKSVGNAYLVSFCNNNFHLRQGRGGFGTVNKMVHRKTNTTIAVKRIRSTVDEKEQKQLLMDLDVVMKSNECNYIVQFYGALFKEVNNECCNYTFYDDLYLQGDCWICMELMDTSLDKFYKFIYERLNQRIPEPILGKIALATVKALNYLKEELKIIHRDVKPSNILLDKNGK